MLVQGSQLESTWIASVRSGGRIGRVKKLIINPHNLHVDALECRVGGQRENQLLLPVDIRSIGPSGIIIDDHERLIDSREAVRLQPILKINFVLNGITAFVGKKRVGTVESFAIERESLFIQKFYIRPGLMSRWSKSQLVFDRSQVEEVTKKKIIFTDSSRQKQSASAIVKLKEQVQASLSTSATKE